MTVLRFRSDETAAREAKRPHVAVRVFIGPDAEHLALAGTLRFRVGDEWDTFQKIIRRGVGTR